MDRFSSWKKYFSIDIKMLPFKMHYLFYTLANCSITYLTVILRNLGITATAVGIIFTISPFVTVLSNPLFGWICDKLKNVKLVMIMAIVIQTPLFCIITFLPSILSESHLSYAKLSCLSNSSYALTSQNFPSLKENDHSIRCESICGECFQLEAIDTFDNLTSCGMNISLEAKLFMNETSVFAEVTNISITGSQLLRNCLEDSMRNCNITCVPLEKENTGKIYTSYQFWTVFVCMISSSTLGSASTALGDAACYEALQERTLQFGKQRVWVSIGWGIGTMFVGFLLDLLNPNKKEGIDYDYSYCAYVMIVFITIDIIILTQTSLKKSSSSKNIFKDIFKLFRKPHPIFVIIAVLVVGGLSGIQWNFVFWYMEDLGASKFLQGLSIAVICLGIEAPFMFFSGWVVKRIGRDNTISLAFASLAIWFLSISFIYNPWWILLIQLSQGPSYALFYTAITSYGKIVTTPGTEATMQTLLSALFYGLGSGCGSMIGGLLFDLYGGRLSYRFCGYFSLGGAVLYKSVTLFVAGENTVIREAVKEENIEVENLNR